MKFKDLLKKDIIIYYMVITAIVNVILMSLFYNHPEHGFEEFGLGAVTTVVFPIMWLMIYLFCRYIYLKNREIDELKSKLGGEPTREGVESAK